MSYYEKYLKYKNKYLMLKSQQNGMRGGTMPRLLSTKTKELEINSNFFEFNAILTNLNKKIQTPDNFYELFINILTGDHTKEIILVDASFMFFLIPQVSVFLSNNYGIQITYNQLFDEFMIRLKQACLEKRKNVIFIFEDDSVLKGSFGSGNRRKSTLQTLYREFTTLLNYDLYKNDIENAIPYILKKLNNDYSSMVLNLQGEADEETFVKAIEYSPVPSTIITVDGDLIISLLLRNRYCDTGKLKDLNIVFIRSSAEDLSTFYIITENKLTDNQTFAKKIFVALLFTSTDAGYGRSIDIKSINNAIDETTKLERKPFDEKMYIGFVRKFIATISVLCYGWGITECVKNMLNELGCKYTDNIMSTFEKHTKGQLLVSVDPYFTISVIAYLLDHLTKLENKEVFMNIFERELIYLLDFEKNASEYYSLCKLNKINSSIFLFNLYEPTGDFSSKIINELYEQPTNYLQTINKEIVTDTIISGNIMEAQSIVKSYIDTKTNKFNTTIKMIYIDKNYLSKLVDKITTHNGKLNLQPFDPKTQTEKLKNFIKEKKYENDTYIIKKMIMRVQEDDEEEGTVSQKQQQQRQPQQKSQNKKEVPKTAE